MPAKMIMVGRNLVEMPPEMTEKLKDKEAAAAKKKEEFEAAGGHPDPVKTATPSMDWTMKELKQFCIDLDIPCSQLTNKTQVLEAITKANPVNETASL